MLITILVTLIISLSLAQPELLEHLSAPSTATAWAMGAYIVGGAVLIIAATRPLALRIERRQTVSSRAFRMRAVLEAVYRCWLIAGQASLICLGYGQWTRRTVEPYLIPLVEHVLLLSPFVVSLVIGWFLDYRFHAAVRNIGTGESDPTTPYWSRGRHVLYNIRHMLLFTVVPIGLILLVMDVVGMYVLGHFPRRAQWPIYLTASQGTAFTVFLTAPLLLKRIWRTRSLEHGQTRDELEDICRRLRLKYRDILVWESDQVIANAAVMGMIAPVRFILVSDGILQRLDRHRLRAVFAHEGGHITSGHLPYLMLLGIAVMTICQVTAAMIAHLTAMSDLQAVILMLAMVMIAGGLLFGAVSRQFERQSDVIGAWASAPNPDNSPRITHEGAAIFAGALQEIARLNGISQNKRNWRHGSIAHRVQYILMLGSTAGTRTDIDNTVKRIKIAIILATITAAAAVATQIRFGW